MLVIYPLLWIISVVLMYEETYAMLYVAFYLISAVWGGSYLLNGIFSLIKQRSNAYMRICFSIGIFVTLGTPNIWGSYAYRVSQIFKLELRKEEYFSSINKIVPDENGKRFYSTGWGGFMLNGIDLVYDESDEIQMKSSMRSETWKRKPNRFQYDECRTQFLLSHFYLVSC